MTKIKVHKSEGYNYVFDETNGNFARWGKTMEDEAIFSPVGAEIADIEISTICHGVENKVCKFCYKSNTPKGEHMTLKTFKKVFHNLPKNIMQIAFGIGDLDPYNGGNPEMWSIFSYTRMYGVVPNVTINGYGLTPEIAEMYAHWCGAVAVSNYDKDVTYNAVQMLSEAGLKQVNIHQLVAEETLSQIFDLFTDYKTDPRLKGLNAIVLLSLKQKGRGTSMNIMSYNMFEYLVMYALDNGVPIGFDSCSATKFMRVLEKNKKYKHLETFVEPCESGLFSIYVNVEGKAFPCSFTEFGEGIDLTKEGLDFLQDVWYNTSLVEWREKLLSKCRSCPVYTV